MPIPTYEGFMLPVLRALRDGVARQVSREILPRVLDDLQLTEEQRHEMLPQSSKSICVDRNAWAVTYLHQAGLIERVARGIYRLAHDGRRALDEGLAEVNKAYLTRYEKFRQFLDRSATPRDKGEAADGPPADHAVAPPSATPEERMDAASREARAALVEELLDRLRRVPPAFFEWLVVELMLKMGYGGPAGGGEPVGGRGDGGVDGVIYEDKLGLDLIYLQAKRWASPVGAAIVRELAGSLEAHRATKGVLITTSRFTADAEQYVERISKRIALIDGHRLAELMIDHGFGVAVERTYLLQRIDSDFFPDEA